ncbi:hypothetical protein [Streptomyces xinghaiensis]|uniref:hypothetical protein n=1 Tax=Streptomyces xinghaiensis TaxID=1038928 RepID=UPI000BB0718B|nr:hypothetical protein [Streptomyces xinghaiensis]
MTARETGVRGTEAVRVRAEGDVEEGALEYLRAKIGAVLDRQGLPPVTGGVRIARANAHHAEHPWTAAAELRVGPDLVVAHAREATSQEATDRLQDRLRRQMERALDSRRTARRSAAPPPWRGGTGEDGPRAAEEPAGDRPA